MFRCFKWGKMSALSSMICYWLGVFWFTQLAHSHGWQWSLFSHILSVRTHFSKYSKTNKFQARTMFTTGETVGLAEWIIDDTSLVYSVFVMVVPRHLPWGHLVLLDRLIFQKLNRKKEKNHEKIRDLLNWRWASCMHPFFFPKEGM